MPPLLRDLHNREASKQRTLGYKVNACGHQEKRSKTLHVSDIHFKNVRKVQCMVFLCSVGKFVLIF